MPFSIPDHDVSLNPNQSQWFGTDVDILTAGLNGVGVVSGCAVTAQGSPDMTVAIAVGTIRIASGMLIPVTAGNGTVTAADSSNPRIDLVSASNTGTKTVTAGTAAANPKPPALPAGHAALALVYVPASDTAINTNQIVDKRVIVPNDVLVGAPAWVFAHGVEPSASLTGGNLGTSGGTYLAQIFVPAPMNLRSLQYRNFDTATARSMEWGLYRDNGTASADQVAYGTDSFTPSAASNRTSAVSSPTPPVLIQPGAYWVAVRNTGGATNFLMGFHITGEGMLGLIGAPTKTLGSALGATLDLSASWTRTSNNIMAVALRGSVFGEGSAF